MLFPFGGAAWTYVSFALRLKLSLTTCRLYGRERGRGRKRRQEKDEETDEGIVM